MSVTYKLQYVYNGTTYHDSWSVRRAIENAENKRFGPEPVIADDREAQTKARITFWAEHNVEYKETEIVIPDPDPSVQLEDARERKLNSLERWFDEYRQNKYTFLYSSLGFKANCNVTAFDNVGGLVDLVDDKTLVPSGVITFMDFEDAPHQLVKSQLQTLKNEISAAGSMAYEVKWTFRKQIKQATSIEQLDAIVFSIDPFSFNK